MTTKTPTPAKWLERLNTSQNFNRKQTKKQRVLAIAKALLLLY
jgi:hypothetical protein